MPSFDVRGLRGLSLLLLTVLLTTQLAGCATRTVRKSVIKRRVAQVDLVSDVKGFATRIPKGYEHPAVISETRLINILNAVEVETPDERGGVVREPAFRPELVEPTAKALREAFELVGPDQELGVKVVRKESQLGVFHRKYLTSFIAYMKDGYLYMLLTRVNWPIPQNKEDDKLPEPVRSRRPMSFRVVSGEHLFYAGPQDLEIAWRDPVFRQPYRLPGSSRGGSRRREILEQSPIPKEELDAKNRGSVPLDSLSPEQLRALADLEEDRRQGRITENAYQRARRQVLRPR